MTGQVRCCGATCTGSTSSLTASGQTLVYHHDGLGSVQSLTDSAGALEWSYAYDPFGAPRRTTKHDLLAPANPMQFTGEYRVEETGMYHLRSRDFDPRIGRLLIPDPLNVPVRYPAVSSYGYVDSRPTFLVDPSGLRGEGARKYGPSLRDVFREALANPIESLKAGLDDVPTWIWWAEGIVFAAAGGVIVCVVASGLCAVAASAAAATGQRIAITGHAVSRAAERGVSLAQIDRTIQAGHRFTYFHNSVWKTGYYDAANRLFVATKGGTVLTVVANVNPSYIASLRGGG